MKMIVAACAFLTGAAIAAGTPAAAADRCAFRDAAGGCAFLHLADHEESIADQLRRRAYERGYRDGLERREEALRRRHIHRERREHWRHDQGDREVLDPQEYREYLERENPNVQSQR